MFNFISALELIVTIAICNFTFVLLDAEVRYYGEREGSSEDLLFSQALIKEMVYMTESILAEGELDFVDIVTILQCILCMILQGISNIFSV